jgi:hypothetical protein
VGHGGLAKPGGWTGDRVDAHARPGLTRCAASFLGHVDCDDDGDDAAVPDPNAAALRQGVEGKAGPVEVHKRFLKEQFVLVRVLSGLRRAEVLVLGLLRPQCDAPTVVYLRRKL